MKPIDFIKIAVRDYKTVGAVTLSSKHVVKRIVKQLKPEYKYIIEYGSGSGVITKEILRLIPKDGKVIAVELNPHLFKELKKIDDSRLVALNKNIVDVAEDFSGLGLPRIDAVISGIPFSFISKDKRRVLILNTHDSLTMGGRFIVYQTSLLMLPPIKRLFHKVRYFLELRNLPPYFIIIAEK